MYFNKRLINTGAGANLATLLHTLDVSSTLDSDKNAIGINSNADFLYLGPTTGTTAYSFTFGTQKDLSTLSFWTSAGVGTGNQTSFGISANGREIYFPDRGNGNTRGWRLSSSWNISGGFSSQRNTTVPRSYDSNPTGYNMSLNGVKLAMVGPNSGAVHEFNISSYNIDTTSYVQSHTLSSPLLTAPNNVHYFNGGSNLMINDNTTSAFYVYDLPTAYSLTGISFSGISFELPDGYKQAFAIDDAGLNLYCVSGQVLYQYSLAL